MRISRLGRVRGENRLQAAWQALHRESRSVVQPRNLDRAPSGFRRAPRLHLGRCLQGQDHQEDAALRGMIFRLVGGTHSSALKTPRRWIPRPSVQKDLQIVRRQPNPSQETSPASLGSRNKGWSSRSRTIEMLSFWSRRAHHRQTLPLATWWTKINYHNERTMIFDSMVSTKDRIPSDERMNRTDIPPLWGREPRAG